MSHLVTINIELKDKQATIAACNRLGWQVKENTQIVYADGKNPKGTVIYIPGWRYPITITNDGNVVGDNYNGAWGDPAKLNQLKQAYGAEVVWIMARRQGRSVYESQNQDGSLILTVRF